MTVTINSISIDEEVYLCSFIQSHNSDNEVELLESELKEKNRGRPKKNTSKIQTESTYESSKNFIIFQHTYPLHKAHSNLSNNLEIKPYFVFLEFFSDQQMRTIV
ncbi:4190_t:CDS:1 [Funneliformis geosporum]|nr:4190_t:CDS:1 [Funneliformis geosporum]